jgi:hypothetical protein
MSPAYLGPDRAARPGTRRLCRRGNHRRHVITDHGYHQVGTTRGDRGDTGRQGLARGALDARR